MTSSPTSRQAAADAAGEMSADAAGDLTVDGSACCGGAVSRVDAEQAAQLANRLGALADPVRLQMLSILAASPSGEVCACDFVGPVDKSQPTVSHHLRVLSDAGLVAGDRRGRWIWYRIASDEIDGVVTTLGDAIRRPAADE